MTVSSDAQTISVIIPVRDGEAYLAEALRSVLDQSRPPDQVIVVDDGSRDRSAAIAAAFAPSVTVLRQEPQGAPAARNLGIDHATGTLLAFLDGDDLWTANKLKWQLAALADDPDLEAVFGHVAQFRSPELSEEAARAIHCPPGDMPGWVAGTMLIRRPAFDQVGRFDTRHRLADLVDWYARALEKRLRLRMLTDVVLHRRLHRSNLGRTAAADRADYARVIKESLDRRRGRVV